MTDITVIIPTIAPRVQMLMRAVESVMHQTHPVRSIIIEADVNKEGAPATRQRALEKVTTPLYLPLDDDDTLKPHAVELLLDTLQAHDADYVYGHFDVIGGTDPFPDHFGRPFDPLDPVETTIVALAKTEVSLQLGGYVPLDGTEDLLDPSLTHTGEDWRLTQRYVDAGKKIIHCPHKVFNWTHHSRNTSGLPNRW